MRTIILSDVHGYTHLIYNVLEHSGYDKEKDKLIFVGDWSDRGPYSKACYEILKENNAIFILGNHEAAHIFQMGIQPYDDTIDFDNQLMAELFNPMLDNTAYIAYVEQGYLLTHAGLSQKFLDSILSKNDMISTIDEIAFYMNNQIKDMLVINGDKIILEKEPLIFLDYHGPMWFRPFENDTGKGDYKVSGLADVPQIFGHSYPTYWARYQRDEIIKNNQYGIDPVIGQFCKLKDNEKHRKHGVYVVIENNNLKYIDIMNNINFMKESEND